MKWLALLKNQKAPDTHAREPRQPPDMGGPAGFLGLQAYPPAPFQKIEASEAAANDATSTPAADPGRGCWQHSTAMNGQEIDTLTARLARFTDKGLTLAQAEQAADRLVIRDREGDDRALCLECTHLQGAAGRWRCGNWQAADVARDRLAPELVAMLQRCPGFGRMTP